jgi:predicted RNA-binding protein (TIGR00451 family)
MLDYEFGAGAGRALPKMGLEFVYSRKSERMKQVLHDGKLLATIRPNGVISPTMHGASVLMKSKAFAENSVVVEADAVKFVKEGRSVFCKFVMRTGRHVLPSGEVVVLDPAGNLIAVGSAKIHGDHMRQFKHGVAVKTRAATGASNTLT